MSSPTPAFVAQARDVSKLFGTSAVLRHVSFQLVRGECVLLLGPNGAGKSTLLRLLAGLHRPSFGTLEVLGRPPEQSRGRIGYMAHATMLYDELTALENLRYAGALYGPGTLGPEDALRRVGLDPGLTRPVRLYSQGMRQRCSLARVLLPRPALLLLDEPFSNLDRPGALEMLALLRELRDTGTTIVLTTHQRELAEPLADRVLTLASGRLSAEEPDAA
jgi:heme ABC exporter ATP-binding subunit CcmA